MSKRTTPPRPGHRRGVLLIFVMVSLAIFSITLLGNIEIDRYLVRKDTANALESELKTIRLATTLYDLNHWRQKSADGDARARSRAVWFVEQELMPPRHEGTWWGDNWRGRLGLLTFLPTDPTLSAEAFGASMSYYWGLVENVLENPSFEKETLASWTHPLTVSATLVAEYPGQVTPLTGELLPLLNSCGEPFKPGTGFCVEIRNQ